MPSSGRPGELELRVVVVQCAREQMEAFAMLSRPEWLVLAVLALAQAGSAHAENSVRTNAAGQPVELRLDLDVERMERRQDGSLLIQAVGIWDGTNVGLAFVSQPRTEGKGDRHVHGATTVFRSDVAIQHMGRRSEAFAGVLRDVFAIQDGDTCFKMFEAQSLTDPTTFDSRLSLVHLFDPQVTGARVWRMECFIDPGMRQMILYVAKPIID